MSRSIRKRTSGHVRPAKIQISLRIRAVWSESSLGAFWIVKDAKFLHAAQADWLDCSDAQADLCHRREYKPEGTFSHVTVQTIYNTNFIFDMQSLTHDLEYMQCLELQINKQFGE